MPDPVTEPTVDSDPKHLRILRGLPRGTYSAEIVYKASSKLPGDRTVRRSTAEFAVLRIDTTDGYTETKVALGVAQQYLDDALAAVELADAEVRRRAEGVDVACRYCKRARHYDGKKSFITGEPGFLSGVRDFSVDAFIRHVYTCRSCGSTEFFADGHLAHPLPGSAQNP
jgi:hypothetical protein